MFRRTDLEVGQCVEGRVTGVDVALVVNVKALNRRGVTVCVVGDEAADGLRRTEVGTLAPFGDVVTRRLRLGGLALGTEKDVMRRKGACGVPSMQRTWVHSRPERSEGPRASEAMARAICQEGALNDCAAGRRLRRKRLVSGDEHRMCSRVRGTVRRQEETLCGRG
jgi:hypothetical protein